MDIVTKACQGKPSCSIPTDTPTFGDPCYDVVKHLVVEATCSTGGGAQQKNGPTSVYAQAFVGDAGTGARKVLVLNPTELNKTVTLSGASGGQWSFVDESTGFGPYATETLSSDTWELAPYAAGVLILV